MQPQGVSGESRICAASWKILDRRIDVGGGQKALGRGLPVGLLVMAQGFQKERGLVAERGVEAGGLIFMALHRDATEAGA